MYSRSMLIQVLKDYPAGDCSVCGSEGGIHSQDCLVHKLLCMPNIEVHSIPTMVNYVPVVMSTQHVEDLHHEMLAGEIFTPVATIVHGLILEGQPITVAQLVLYLKAAVQTGDTKMIELLSDALYWVHYLP